MKSYLVILVFTLLNLTLFSNGYIYAQNKPSHITTSLPLYLSPEKTCLKFIKWYTENEPDLLKNIFNIDTIGDTTKLITVNFESVRRLKLKLSQSKFFSEKFIVSIIENYYQVDNFLKAHPTNDGPLVQIDLKDNVNIDYARDPIMLIDYEDDFPKNLNFLKAKEIFKENKHALVTLKGGKYLTYIFLLNKKKEKWIIDSISYYYN